MELCYPKCISLGEKQLYIQLEHDEIKFGSNRAFSIKTIGFDGNNINSNESHIQIGILP